MKHTLTIILILFFFSTFAQKLTYTEWQENAKQDIRFLPKFGNAIKTAAQKEADDELIKSYVAQAGTHKKASDLLIKLGFDYLYKSDLKTAMFRFNQAWILDPTNENVFWGFGAIYSTFKDYDKAFTQYDEGLKLNPNSSTILTDKATIYMMKYNNLHDEKDYQSALKFFTQSYSIDPKNQNTLFKLSVCYFFKKDCENAVKYYDECKALGGKPITTQYTAALTESCKK